MMAMKEQDHCNIMNERAQTGPAHYSFLLPVEALKPARVCSKRHN